ncbi:hypothetical protein FHY55_17120 [Oceanicola sp. D3]|uniref:hypothetical protein n=1 Tax=Oceanicola sp. D3 TaxID=2587163 RepID=UPI00111E9909|nr:hypothetical protein [Oceanicola sp. D3]QDC10849.1 hypothetical protein FHY55_17120 [Oceanicola sp. D3]
MRPFLNLAYLACCGWITWIGLWWPGRAKGFVPGPAEGEPFYCNQLMSTGGEDDLMVALFLVFALPLAVRAIAMLFAGPGRAELALWGLATSLAGFGLFLASLDCAAVFYTAFTLPAPGLAAALIALPLSGVLLWALRRFTNDRRLR